jgi:hypothetical protein
MRIAFRPDSEVRLQAVGGAAAFAVRSGGVSVRNRGSAASYDVVVPSSATSVEIRVAGRPVFVKRGATVTTGPRHRGDGSYIIDFSPPAPPP